MIKIIQFLKDFLIKNIIQKYKPNKIFFFSGQSSLTKSIKSKKETLSSHYDGTKNFLDILKSQKLDTKFFKANSGYIFLPKNGLIHLNCKFSSNDNPYIKAQQEVFNLIKIYRKFGLNLSNLIFMQIESPLRKNDFFIKKVCLGAKNKKKIIVGNLNTLRDYSWITDVVKAVFLTSNLKSKDYIISAGKKLSGIEIIKTAYNLNKLDYRKYFSINKMSKKIEIINGPNINLLGKREPNIYGNLTLESINKEIEDYLSGVSVELEIEMPNGKEMVQKIRGADGKYSTQLMIDTEFPVGEYIIKVKYLGKIYDASTFTVVK